MIEIFTEDIPEYGDRIPLKEWLECVNTGGFIDYDGFGAASNGQKCTKERYYPSMAVMLPEGTKEIIWFNR